MKNKKADNIIQNNVQYYNKKILINLIVLLA